MNTQVKTVTIASNGNLSALNCSDCGTFFSFEYEVSLTAFYSGKCHKCGANVRIHDVNVAVRPSSAHLLDADVALKATWYHATNNPNWLDDITDPDKVTPLVHVGTKKTALARAHDIMVHAKGDLYLYELTLVSDTSIGATLVDDEDNWETDVSSSTYPADAMRYINKWEATGEISMIIDPNCLEFIGQTTIRHIDAPIAA